MRYDSLAQYDNPARNVLPRFCNASDEEGEKTQILNKIIDGLVASRGHGCFNIFNFSHSNDDGWDWQVLHFKYASDLQHFLYVFFFSIQRNDISTTN